MIRVFRDSQGVEWRVWSTHPAEPSTVSAELRDGWLTFDSGVERRRVGPIPTGWELHSEEHLEMTCRAAVPTRVSDPHRKAIVEEEDSKPDGWRMAD